MGSWFKCCICLKMVAKTADQNVLERLNFTERLIRLQDYVSILFDSCTFLINSIQFHLIVAERISDSYHY
jgi:hypothetical protein